MLIGVKSVCVCVCVCVRERERESEGTLSNLDHSVTYGEVVLCEIDIKDLTFTVSFTVTRDI